ncbi:hypothetical protein EV141_1419 [Microcella putealis]|uniref:Uncharacterized protein n=1 Tax=Microcella putealis TaxID=337005 RepID=A0A4Q7LTB6_9MICO|nr:hypothetical protein [Microcella putealis]RZS57701.1 hypothetical protein EV141_1419 [Microcella putealis]TQM24768.1 hypothetical protein BJ957_1028 [Microcella putealis]
MTDDPTLDTLDDATLRGIAYGRADSESERMRAQRAARILADRGDHARGAEALLPAAAPADEPAASADTVELDDDDPTGWWTRSRRIGAALLVGGLVVGAGAAIAYERLIPTLADDSLAVFEREESEADAPPIDQFGSGLPGESRLIGTVGDVDIYGVRTESGVLFGSSALGPQICLSGWAENVQFIPTTCTPETVFRENGLSGSVIGYDVTSVSASGIPDFTRVIAVEWGPRGPATVTDMSAEIAAAAGDAFSEAQRAAGDDLRLAETLAELEVAPEAVALLVDVVPPPSLGPAQIGELTTSELGTARVFASIHGGSAENPLVCVGVLALDEFSDNCVPVEVFRRDGITLGIPTASGTSFFSLDADSDGTVTIMEESR